jgi:hypothetical protein
MRGHQRMIVIPAERQRQKATAPAMVRVIK